MEWVDSTAIFIRYNGGFLEQYQFFQNKSFEIDNQGYTHIYKVSVYRDFGGTDTSMQMAQWFAYVGENVNANQSVV